MSQIITYKTIWQTLLIDFKSAGKSNQQIRNHESVIKQWIGFFKKSWEENPVEFENFEDNLHEFLSNMNYANISIPSRKYWLTKFFKIYLNFKTNIELPKSFPERLNFLKMKLKISRRQIANIFGVNINTVSDWCHGRQYPKKKHFNNFHKLEKLLNVTEGSLSGLIRFWHGDVKNKKTRIPKTEFSKLQKIRSRLKYRLHFEQWPEHTKSQWQLLKNHHTSQIAPVLPRNPSSIWYKQRTVISRMQLFEYFFGFITLSEKLGGLGLNKSVCDLRLIYEINTQGNLKYFEPYMDFHKQRTICNTYPTGVYTKTIERDLKAIAVFINTKNGFMRKAPHFSDYVSSIGLSWNELCDKALNRIISLTKGTNFTQLRFPGEPIDFILNDQHPLKYLRSLINNLKKDLPTTIIRSYERKLLNIYFVCSFLAAIPLRAQMLCKMRLNKNIYQDQDRNWRVRFDAIDFKNHNFAAKDSNYDVPCPSWLCRVINFYLKYRPSFPGGRVINEEFECEYFIRPSVNNGVHEENNRPIEIATLYDWCRTATQKYIPGCNGFGPHAWRHIVTTDWIKNNPNGIQIAAKVLHDRFETVMKNYQHLMTSDWLFHYNIYSDSNFMTDEEYIESKPYSDENSQLVDDKNGYFELLKIEKNKNRKLEGVIDNQVKQIRVLKEKLNVLASKKNGA